MKPMDKLSHGLVWLINIASSESKRNQVWSTCRKFVIGTPAGPNELVKVAAGEPLNIEQDDIQINGHAIECRINAEDPETFMPSPGKVDAYHKPAGFGIRMESAIYAGYKIPPHYDSMVAKLIAHNNTRGQCIKRVNTALREYVISGIKSNIPLHQKIIAQNDFLNGDYNIHWLEKFIHRK